jgi:hypothetical protein
MAGWCTSEPQNAFHGFDVSFPVKNLRLLIFQAGAGSTTCVARVALLLRAERVADEVIHGALDRGVIAPALGLQEPLSDQTINFRVV